MERLLVPIFVLICTFLKSAIASPIGYEAILAVVIIELVFAFSVGLVCVVFSFNLFFALKDSPDTEVQSGNLPANRPRNNSSGLTQPLTGSNPQLNQLVDGSTDYRTFPSLKVPSNSRHHNTESDEELDFNTPRDDAESFLHRDTYNSNIDDNNEPRENNLAGLARSFTNYLKLW